MLHILVDKLPIVLPKTAVRNEAFELGECASRRVRAHTQIKSICRLCFAFRVVGMLFTTVFSHGINNLIQLPV